MRNNSKLTNVSLEVHQKSERWILWGVIGFNFILNIAVLLLIVSWIALYINSIGFFVLTSIGVIRAVFRDYKRYKDKYPASVYTLQLNSQEAVVLHKREVEHWIPFATIREVFFTFEGKIPRFQLVAITWQDQGQLHFFRMKIKKRDVSVLSHFFSLKGVKVKHHNH